MDGVVKKLRADKAERGLVLRPPDELAALRDALGAALPRLDLEREPGASYGFVLAFARSMDEARELAPVMAEAIEPEGLLWLGFPKGTSKRYRGADINRDKSWDVLAPFGLRPVANVALDDDWSAMRFRPGTM